MRDNLQRYLQVQAHEGIKQALRSQPVDWCRHRGSQAWCCLTLSDTFSSSLSTSTGEGLDFDAGATDEAAGTSLGDAEDVLWASAAADALLAPLARA
jgi:ABC-type uncharacterized transport system permease subunit